MWCNKCHAGSENCDAKKDSKCVQCGGKMSETKKPWPDRVMEGKGSGQPRKRQKSNKELALDIHPDAGISKEEADILLT